MAFDAIQDIDWRSPWTLLSVGVAAVVIKKVVFDSRPPYPPGPKPWPIIGNIPQIPVSFPWLAYMDWGKKYNSDVVYARAFNQHVVVVNSIRAANDLLEKRNYADRPYLPMLHMMGWNYNIAFLQYGDEWRLHRRALQEAFRPVAVAMYRNNQLAKVHDHLRSLITMPDDLFSHIKTVAAAVTMATVYGYDIAPKDDYFVTLSEEAVANLAKSTLPSAALVNMFPFLRYIPSWFPGGWFHHFAKENRDLLAAILDKPFNIVRQQMKEGTARQSILSTFLEVNDANGGDAVQEEIIKKVTAASYSAGSDTTVSSIGTFYLAMVLHQDVQRKAQEELDRVVGNRLPEYNDRKNLPYCEAIYREVMRWRIVSPLGVPHATLEDDIIVNQHGKPFFVPKGAMVLSNIWAMTHDENVYPEPDAFKPERFLTPDGKLNNDSTVLAYGFGRRICAGRYMADETVWLMIVSVLSMFNLRKAKDENGNEIEVSGEYTDASISHPVPFKYSITPRSSEARKIIEATEYESL